MNEDGLDIRKIEALENLIKEQVERQQIPITFINASRDGVMGKQYFADTNYHLTLEGAKILTRTLIAGLMSFYENESDS